MYVEGSRPGQAEGATQIFSLETADRYKESQSG